MVSRYLLRDVFYLKIESRLKLFRQIGTYSSAGIVLKWKFEVFLTWEGVDVKFNNI